MTNKDCTTQKSGTGYYSLNPNGIGRDNEYWYLGICFKTCASSCCVGDIYVYNDASKFVMSIVVQFSNSNISDRCNTLESSIYILRMQ